MSFPKILAIITVVLFGTIAIAALFKRKDDNHTFIESEITIAPVELDLEEEIALAQAKSTIIEIQPEIVVVEEAIVDPYLPEEELPYADKVDQLFSKGKSKLPVVETITYEMKVPWLKGRAAWIADYASHYKTSRHFIARSLNGKPLYDKQNVANGDRFNVFKEGVDLSFYLLVDLHSIKMWFYYLDGSTNERVLLKRYDIGLGRLDDSAESGSLTPLGKYSLGNKIAVYRPKTMAYHQGEKVEMVRVFGTRWIPFGEEIDGCTLPAKGFGIHGLPLERNAKGELVENKKTLGCYESDGCIRMATDDVEELFSIIITNPATIEIVDGFHKAKLPGKETQG